MGIETAQRLGQKRARFGVSAVEKPNGDAVVLVPVQRGGLGRIEIQTQRRTAVVTPMTTGRRHTRFLWIGRRQEFSPYHIAKINLIGPALPGLGRKITQVDGWTTGGQERQGKRSYDVSVHIHMTGRPRVQRRPAAVITAARDGLHDHPELRRAPRREATPWWRAIRPIGVAMTIASTPVLRITSPSARPRSRARPEKTAWIEALGM